MKKSILYPSAVIAILLTFGFIAWAFSQHGTYGLFHVVSFFRFIFIGLGVLGFILIALTLLHVWLTRHGKKLRFLATPIIVLAALEIILPVFAFVYLSGMMSPKVGDASPRLMVISDTGMKTLHIAVGGDAHFGAGTNHPDLTAQMLDQISSPDNGYDYFFFLGDLVENGFHIQSFPAKG